MCKGNKAFKKKSRAGRRAEDKKFANVATIFCKLFASFLGQWLQNRYYKVVIKTVGAIMGFFFVYFKVANFLVNKMAGSEFGKLVIAHFLFPSREFLYSLQSRAFRAFAFYQFGRERLEAIVEAIDGIS